MKTQAASRRCIPWLVVPDQRISHSHPRERAFASIRGPFANDHRLGELNPDRGSPLDPSMPCTRPPPALLKNGWSDRGLSRVGLRKPPRRGAFPAKPGAALPVQSGPCVPRPHSCGRMDRCFRPPHLSPAEHHPANRSSSRDPRPLPSRPCVTPQTQAGHPGPGPTDPSCPSTRRRLHSRERPAR